MRFLDPALIEDPYPHYDAWREDAPIWRDRETGAWVLSRHDDVRAVLKNSTAFSSAAMGGDNPLPLLTDDPPRHTQLRGLINKAFTSRMLKHIEPDVREIADRLVADVPEGTSVDIIRGLTIPLPVAVISRMMGIPAERADDFKRWSDALTGTLAGVPVEERRDDVMEMVAFFSALIPERRTRPGDDLVSAIVNAEVDGERLSDQDIVGFNILLLIAGNETTTNLLGNFLNVVADRPDLWAALRANPDVIDAGIEETLRFDSPVQLLLRRALRPMTFHGHEIAAGETVHVMTGSANRDPRIYDRPDEFRLDRGRTHHHAFGFGIHFCIGAPLARLEARAAMSALVGRFGQVGRGAGRDERTASQLLRGFNRLWLQFD